MAIAIAVLVFFLMLIVCAIACKKRRRPVPAVVANHKVPQYETIQVGMHTTEGIEEDEPFNGLYGSGVVKKASITEPPRLP